MSSPPVVERVTVEKRRRASEKKVRYVVDRDRALFLGVRDGWKLLEDGNPVVLAVPEEPCEVRREVLAACASIRLADGGQGLS